MVAGPAAGVRRRGVVCPPEELAKTIPEGANVTVPVHCPKPEAWAVYVAVPLLARPSTENSGLAPAFSGRESVIAAAPAPALVFENRSFEGSLLVTVIETPPGGAIPFRPTRMVV